MPKAERVSLVIPAVDGSQNDILTISRVISEEIMAQLQKDKLQPVNRITTSYIKSFTVILVIIAILSTLGWIIWKTYQANNLGFINKTLWDWMELLVVPTILAFLAYFLNKSQKDTELRIAEIRRTEEREAAEERTKVDREIEKDRQQQKALEDYLDHMTELLLQANLRKSSSSDEVRSIARTRTLTILRNFNGARKSQLIQFLYESSLIGEFTGDRVFEEVIDLSFADLQYIELTYGKLDGINLPKINVRNSNFEYASLIGANFYLSDLDDSNFNYAKLMKANLHASLKRVNLVGANLENADLKNANLCGAKLWHTNFKGANLQHANFLFKNPYLHSENNLEVATLMNVDLSGADLRSAIISPNQLLGVKSLSNAILPNGQKFEIWKEKCNLKHGETFYADDLYKIKDFIGLTDIENYTYK